LTKALEFEPNSPDILHERGYLLLHSWLNSYRHWCHFLVYLLMGTTWHQVFILTSCLYSNKTV
jgi:hypothetical protein